MQTITFADGSQVPAIGQGTWRMGERRDARSREIAALQLGIDLGMTLIDTAEMYADGGAEELVGAAIRGRREQVFVVSKLYPQHASRGGLPAACERSLQRLGIEALDLYLLHWPGSYPLAETVEAFELLRQQGKIRRWGVSNFDMAEMGPLQDTACATNQVLYNLHQRGIEYDLLPWCQQQAMPVMAYCPVGQGGTLLQHPALTAIARRYEASPARIALAWLLGKQVLAIPKAVSPAHVRDNAAAADLQLAESDRSALDQAFPAPRRKQPLAIV